MTLAEAIEEVQIRGRPAGDVIPQLAVRDVAPFKAWYVRSSRTPNLRAREGQKPVVTGDVCHKCGGPVVRTGSCLTCQWCADASGGCS